MYVLISSLGVCNFMCSSIYIQVSAASDAGSMGEGFGLSMVSTTPDEQSQVFMVLEEAVSKSVVSLEVSLMPSYHAYDTCVHFYDTAT